VSLVIEDLPSSLLFGTEIKMAAMVGMKPVMSPCPVHARAGCGVR
jgi:hypothetical protein